MHKYLRAIGFTDLKKKDLEILVQNIVERPETMKATTDSEKNELIEFTQSYAPGVGIVVRGTYNDEDEFEPEYSVPYFNGTEITTNEEIDVAKHAEKESYAGICDDPNLGLTLIFYINNVADYLTANKKDPENGKVKGAALSGLACEGKILLPIEKKKIKTKYSNENRDKLVAEARDGSAEAIQDLTLQDMDVYALLTKRVQKEDLLTIVSTYFMPYGIESDQYAILGEIETVDSYENCITHEKLYQMRVNCNNLHYKICINEKDLTGEPAVGRRIKANIWMQGIVNL